MVGFNWFHRPLVKVNVNGLSINQLMAPGPGYRLKARFLPTVVGLVSDLGPWVKRVHSYKLIPLTGNTHVIVVLVSRKKL